jgi:hypothetical protein
VSAQSKLHNDAVIEAYDFAGIQTLIDVGGGHGATLNAILARYPQMKGVVFDLPEVAVTAVTAFPGTAERCQFAGGNMFEIGSAGGDACSPNFILEGVRR